jgi:guanylate kinase
MAIVIFVGCDKVGKSTLFQNVLKKTNRHICIDRFTACQYVYGLHNEKGHDTPSLTKLRDIESGMASLGAIFIHTVAEIEDIKERFHQHKEIDIELDHISKVMSNYETYLKDTSLPVVKINTSVLSIDEAVEEIISQADRIDRYVG